ncbi:hypothetical protein LZ30DRAFT_412107 [Colletotrichum cereale]|nr:hypothetical protein LZ30DRAFT_412107 [Colletotrichum cereale]
MPALLAKAKREHQTATSSRLSVVCRSACLPARPLGETSARSPLQNQSCSPSVSAPATWSITPAECPSAEPTLATHTPPPFSSSLSLLSPLISPRSRLLDPTLAGNPRIVQARPCLDSHPLLITCTPPPSGNVGPSVIHGPVTAADTPHPTLATQPERRYRQHPRRDTPPHACTNFLDKYRTCMGLASHNGDVGITRGISLPLPPGQCIVCVCVCVLGRKQTVEEPCERSRHCEPCLGRSIRGIETLS